MKKSQTHFHLGLIATVGMILADVTYVLYSYSLIVMSCMILFCVLCFFVDNINDSDDADAV